MIYTCYDMIRDCRANKPEGWAWFTSNYAKVIRRLLEHYTGSSANLDAIAAEIREPLFREIQPMPERQFLALLRQQVLARISAPEPELPLDLETVATAFAPLTVVEKQAVWFDAMRYDDSRTGPMLRISGKTVETIRH